MQLINFKKLDSDNYDVITLTFFGWRQVASQSNMGVEGKHRYNSVIGKKKRRASVTSEDLTRLWLLTM